jgi:hypothetical protein
MVLVDEVLDPGLVINNVPLYFDNNSAPELTHNQEFHNRSKYIDVKYHFIREKAMGTEENQTIHVSTKENLADILLKSPQAPDFKEVAKKIGMGLRGSKVAEDESSD